MREACSTRTAQRGRASSDSARGAETPPVQTRCPSVQVVMMTPCCVRTPSRQWPRCVRVYRSNTQRVQRPKGPYTIGPVHGPTPQCGLHTSRRRFRPAPAPAARGGDLQTRGRARAASRAHRPQAGCGPVRLGLPSLATGTGQGRDRDAKGTKGQGRIETGQGHDRIGLGAGRTPGSAWSVPHSRLRRGRGRDCVPPAMPIPQL